MIHEDSLRTCRAAVGIVERCSFAPGGRCRAPKYRPGPGRRPRLRRPGLLWREGHPVAELGPARQGGLEADELLRRPRQLLAVADGTHDRADADAGGSAQLDSAWLA